MAYTHLYPDLPLKSILTPDHLAHIENGIVGNLTEAQGYTDAVAVQIQAGQVTDAAFDAAVDRAAADGRLVVEGGGGEAPGVEVTETQPGAYQFTSGDMSAMVYGLTATQKLPNVAKADAASDLGNDSTALGAAAVAKFATLDGQGRQPVRRDDLVYNILDHGAVGDGVTDDVAAVEALGKALSAAGGGTILFPAGRTYAFARAAYCYSNVEYSGHGATIRNTTSASLSSSIPSRLGAFIPGAIYGGGLNPANGADAFPSKSINNVAEGDITITASTAGAFAAIAIGDFVAVRSTAHYLVGTGLFPRRIYYSKVIAATPDTLTLADTAPYALTGALVHHLKGNPEVGPTDGAGSHQYMVENVSIHGFGIDAHFPLWGGGAYGFRMSGIRPVNRPRFSSFVTVNALVNFEIWDCIGDWYYQFCELKLGSANGLFRNNVGTYGVGTSLGVPVNFGEGSRNIRFRQNVVNIPATFNDGTKPIVDVSHSVGVRVEDNDISVNGTCDNIFLVAGASNAGSESVAARVVDNRVFSAGNANRYFLVGAANNTFPPAQFSIRDNVLTGTTKANVGEWISLNSGQDFIVRDNIVPAGLTANIGPNTRGRFDGPVVSTAYASHVTVPQAMTGHVNTSNSSRTIGRVSMRGAVSHVRVEVTTAFNGTGSSVLNVGYSGTAGAYVSAVDVSATGVKYIVPGGANSGTRLGSREVGAARDVVAAYAGTGATTGSAVVTVYYEPLIQPGS